MLHLKFVSESQSAFLMKETGFVLAFQGSIFYTRLLFEVNDKYFVLMESIFLLHDVQITHLNFIGSFIGIQ